MHPALTIAELRSHICAFADQHDCAALARVNRAFVGPALDALWYRLDRVGPLIALLPPSFLDSSVQTTLASAAAASRFLAYATRVRHLSFSGTDEPAALSLLASLAVSPSQPPICLAPQLRTLFWDAPTAETALAARFFLSSNLLALSLYADAPPHTYIASILPIFADLATHRCPSLHHLSLASAHSPSVVSPRLTDAALAAISVTGAAGLGSLHLDLSLVHAQRLFPTLAALPNLHTLHLTVHASSDVPPVSSAGLTQAPCFQALDTFILDGSSAGMIASLRALGTCLGAGRSGATLPILREAFLSPHEALTPNSLRTLLAALVVVSGPTLEYLNLHAHPDADAQDDNDDDDDEADDGDDSEVADYDRPFSASLHWTSGIPCVAADMARDMPYALQPLAACAGLRGLAIELGGARTFLRLSSAEVAQCARAWPLLPISALRALAGGEDDGTTVFVEDLDSSDSEDEDNYLPVTPLPPAGQLPMSPTLSSVGKNDTSLFDAVALLLVSAY